MQCTYQRLQSGLGTSQQRRWDGHMQGLVEHHMSIFMSQALHTCCTLICHECIPCMPEVSMQVPSESIVNETSLT